MNIHPTHILDILIILNTCIDETCINKQTPLSLPHHACQQGGLLPRKQPKVWKQHLKTYHVISKVTCIINTPILPHLDYPRRHTTTANPCKYHPTTYMQDNLIKQ